MLCPADAYSVYASSGVQNLHAQLCNRCSDGCPAARHRTPHSYRSVVREAEEHASPARALSGRGALVQPEGLAGADCPPGATANLVWRGCSQQILFLMDVSCKERTGEGRSLSSHHFSPSYYSYRISSKLFSYVIGSGLQRKRLRTRKHIPRTSAATSTAPTSTARAPRRAAHVFTWREWPTITQQGRTKASASSYSAASSLLLLVWPPPSSS